MIPTAPLFDPSRVALTHLNDPAAEVTRVRATLVLTADETVTYAAMILDKGGDLVERTKRKLTRAVWRGVYGEPHRWASDARALARIVSVQPATAATEARRVVELLDDLVGMTAPPPER